MNAVVAWSIANRWGVVSAAGLFLLIGALRLVPALPIDAVPDVSNVQVQVLTDSPGLSAEEVERFVTFPVEMGLTGMPGLKEMRSTTRAGLSAVSVIFEDGTDIWFARQLVVERLRTIEAEIPREFGRPELAPVSTALGEIFWFVLKSEKHSPAELRTMLEWEISPKLRTVPGVIEVNALGGVKKQYDVLVDPRRLAAHRLTVTHVLDVLAGNNLNVGGGYIERGPEALTIRGEGQLRTLDDIADVVVTRDEDGTPVLLKHLAAVRVGGMLPQGVVTQVGAGEVVTGIVMMLIGQNSRNVVAAVQKRIAEIQAKLPEGARIEVVYDRAEFIGRTLQTVFKNLAEGALLVTLVILILLGSFKGSLLVVAGIPTAMFIAIAGMLRFGITGNLMSLGAIDFGFLVDGPIVMLEAVIARLAMEHVSEENRVAEISDAVQQVTRPVIFAVTIILLVYLPLMTLEDVEGKMFRPMAGTMALALFGSVVFSLVVFPAACAAFLSLPKHKGAHGILHAVEGPYERALRFVMNRKTAVLALSGAALAVSLRLGGGLGANFVPRIEEGDIMIQIRRLPSVGLAEAKQLDESVHQVLAEFPEVETSLALTGRAEVATDPVGLDTTYVLTALKDKSAWKNADNFEALGAIIKERIEARVPSTFVSVSQPIEDNVNAMISGARADVAIKVFGPDLNVLTELTRRIAKVVRTVSGAADVRVERALGAPMLAVRLDRAKLARYAIPGREVLATVAAARVGNDAGVIFEGNRRYGLRVMMPPDELSAEGLARLPVGSAAGEVIPLAQVASIGEEDGPAMISREALERRLRVEVNIRGRDLVGFVADARQRVDDAVRMPAGYRVEWGGQFENFNRASARLAIVVPVVLVIIVVMLYLSFGDLRYALAVFSGVPFALVGGIVALWARGMAFSIPAAVGFIALCGIAVLNGVIAATEIRRRVAEGEAPDDALITGAVRCLAPMMLTSAVAALGFLPMALSTSAGSEVQQPLATAVIGGIVSSTVLGLFVLPILLKLIAFAGRGTAPASATPIEAE